MRNISAWAIRNPVIPMVLFTFLLAMGVLAFNRMDINLNPDVTSPAANVSISQPGAAPPELEVQITRRVEAAVRGINGVNEINSTIREGNSNTFISFEIGTPEDRAVSDVRDAIARIRGDLPEGILEPQVERVDFTDEPIGYFSAESTAMTVEQLSWFIDDTLNRRLMSIEGVSVVSRTGGVSREIKVELDPVRLQAQGVTASQINQQLRQVNLNAAGGRAEIAGSEQSVRVLGSALTAHALGESQISVGGGRTIRLNSIANVRDQWAEQTSYGIQNGRQVVSFMVQKAKGHSDVTVYHEVQRALDELTREDPRVRYTLLFTPVKYIEMQYESSMRALVEGALLAVIVVFLFLRDWRATLISAIAIPLSAIPAFWFMDMLGFTLNMVTLLSLSLVAGVLVDDAIVEIENIVRHMRMGKSAYQASIDAADEIGLPVVATTFSIVAVFLPVAMMSGLIGQFFISFGLTIVIAVLISLAVARMITPMIAAYFLKAHGEAKHGEGWLMDRYVRLLRWTLVHRWKTMAVGVLAFVATIGAFATLPFTFQPNTDDDTVQVSAELPPGATLEQTRVIADRAAAVVLAQPDVKSAFESVRAGNATIYISLKDRDEGRERTSTEFQREVGPLLQSIADARVGFRNAQRVGGRDVSVLLAGSDPAKLQAAALTLVEQMRQRPELRAPRIAGDLRRPEITIQPRQDLMADLGITTAAMSQAIRVATQGEIDQASARFSLSDRQVPIRVALTESARRNLSTIENMPVPTTSGGSVPLKVVADISFGAGPSVIQRIDQQRRVMVGADLAPGVVDGETIINELPIMQNLPEGVERARSGQQREEAQLVSEFLTALVSGTFLVFAVLVLLYKRLMAPFVNMGSLLLAPLGGAIALHIAGHAVSMPVMIGILMLFGIVAKNSILLLDFTIEEMGKGVPKNDAIIDAGHKRAQPIVMTTMAMVAGMVPTALSLEGDASWRAPMAVVVIGGLLLSTLLTLVLVPATFSLADSFERWLAPKFRRVITYRGKDDHGPEQVPQPAE
ncbi:MAG TPA: efflux RND transporter permease subunit [Allosphingosinicella sp.]|uniref:efflux RND transporter permease subunit n=1 Tax=Allosphingosinicella sp. TaxID=2823234 RepID=UPI002ED95A9F